MRDALSGVLKYIDSPPPYIALLLQVAGINMIEAAYKLKPLKHRSWKLLEQAFEVGRVFLNQFHEFLVQTISAELCCSG